MELLIKIFGEGKDLTWSQMSCRGIAIFFIALILIRISGRRSFGLRMPLDNIITISLGAILSRAVVGASPFLPVIACCSAIVILHRLFGSALAHSPQLSRIIEGNRLPLFDNGSFNRQNMNNAQVWEEDLMQGIRRSALTEDLEKIDKVYMERNGEISAIKK